MLDKLGLFWYTKRMTELDEDKQRVISICDDRQEFVTDSDGFVYWWPDGSSNGHLSSAHLRWIADELDSRNKEWAEKIDSYFKGFGAD